MVAFQEHLYGRLETLVCFRKTFHGYEGLPLIFWVPLQCLSIKIELTHFINHPVPSTLIRCRCPA